MQADPLIKRLQVIQVITETNDTKTLVLAPLDGWNPSYKAGQFLTLAFYTSYGEKRRSYSISSSPALDEPLSITIKKIDNGEFSRLLVYNTKVGDILFSSGIGGLFQLPESINNTEQFFFIAAGSGITPCYSLIKTLLAASNKKLVLIYSNRTKEDAIFYEGLKKLQKKYTDRFDIRFLFSSLADVYQSRLSHWLLQQLLDEYLVVDEDKAMFYICGPFEYMRTVSITLSDRISPQRILKENFNSLPRLVMPKPPDTNQHQVTIHINKQVHKINVQYPQTILAAAKSNNIELPYSCQAGRCASCIANCTKGEIWMAYNEVLMDEEIEKGRVLVCQSFPVNGDVEIVY